MPTDWATIARDMERRSTPPPPGGQDDGTGGLVIPGANRPYQPPPRERGLNEMIGGLGGMALEAADMVPRYAAWNLGPMLVGRNGQGPLNGADALRGAGILQGSHGQRAIAAGLGAGLDFLGQPMMLGGMGAGRAASANPVTARLARMVAPVNESNAAGRQVMQARIDNWMQGVGNPGRDFVTGAPRAGFAGGLGVDADLARRHAGGLGRDPGPLARPPAVLADTVPGGVAVAAPGRTGRAVPGMRGYVDPAGYGYDADALRSFQLNHPSFNPAEPAFGLGTGQFTQDAGQAARHGLGEYNPLTTAGSQPAASANPLTAQLQQLAGGTPSRFDRMIPARPLPQIPSEAAAEASANLAARLRQGQSPSARPPTQPLGEVVPPEQMGWQPSEHSRLENAAQRAGFENERNYVASYGGYGPVIPPRSPLDLSARTATTPEFRDIFAGMSEADKARLAGEIRPTPVDRLAGTSWLESQSRSPTLPSGAGMESPGVPPRSFSARTGTTPDFQGPMFPPAPATSGTPAPFATGANQPPELGGLNLRAAWEALRGGRGRTLPFGRGDTLPNGPIDY